jgi:uncharacterized protein (TIGR02118 family)
MYRVLALYPKPSDPEHFRDYYSNTHMPIAAKLPGLKSMRYSMEVEGVMGDSPYFCVAELEFESQEALLAALQSPEGQATAGDVQNYATGGIVLIQYDLTEYPV